MADRGGFRADPLPSGFRIVEPDPLPEGFHVLTPEELAKPDPNITRSLGMAPPKSADPLRLHAGRDALASNDPDDARRIQNAVRRAKTEAAPRAPVEEPADDTAVAHSAAKPATEGVLAYLGRGLASGGYAVASMAGDVAESFNPVSAAQQGLSNLKEIGHQLASGDLVGDKASAVRHLAERDGSTPFTRFSEQMQRDSQEIDQSEGGKKYSELVYATTDPAKSALLSPVRMIHDFLQSIPSTAAMGTTIFLTRGAAAKGYAEAIAAGFGKSEARVIAIKAAGKMASLAGAVGEGIVGGVQQSVGTRTQILDGKPGELDASPIYQTLIKSGVSPADAKQYVATEAGSSAGLAAGAVDAAANAAEGPILGRIIGEGGGIFKRTLKGFLTEGAVEGAQGAGEQIGENVAVQHYADPTRKLADNVVENVVASFVVGGITGGLFSAVGGSDIAKDKAAGDSVDPVDAAPPVAPSGTPVVPGAPIIDPMQRQALHQGAATVTADDESSALPTDLIAQGRGQIDIDTQASGFNDVLRKYGLPVAGSDVVVNRGPDGAPETGKMVGTFDVTDNLGTKHGVRIAMNDGSTYEELIDDVKAGGHSIRTLEDYTTPKAEPAPAPEPAQETPVSEARPVEPAQHRGGPRTDFSSYTPKMRQVESGGNDNAKNPKSTAAGRYQFIDSTWEALGGDPSKRYDAAENERIIGKLNRNNAAALEKAGFAATDGNLYLAHFLGAGGARNALANPNAEVSAAVQEANPFAKGWTNARLASWATRKMGGKPGEYTSNPNRSADKHWADQDKGIDYVDLQFAKNPQTGQAELDGLAPQAADDEGPSYSEKVNTAFDKAKAERDALETKAKEASAALAAFPKDDKLGLTPDSVKLTPEWQKAKVAYDGAAKDLAAFNGTFTKEYKDELAAERAARVPEGDAPAATKGDTAAAEPIRVFHGGPGIDGELRTPFYVSPDEGFAKSYADERGRDTGGKVDSFDFTPRKLAKVADVEEAARAVGLPEDIIDQMPTGVLLDNMQHDGAPDVVAELRRRGFDAAEFYDVPMDGGFTEKLAYAVLDPAALKAASRSAPTLEGKKIDANWSEFSPESGTLGIPRAEMPQIKGEHRGAMVNFLNAGGISHTDETIDAASLKPTQREFSPQKVAQWDDGNTKGTDRAILVSSDNHVVDGHHQWVNAVAKGEQIRAIRLGAPIKTVLDAMKLFPSADVADGSTPAGVTKADTPDTRPDYEARHRAARVSQAREDAKYLKNPAEPADREEAEIALEGGRKVRAGDDIHWLEETPKGWTYVRQRVGEPVVSQLGGGMEAWTQGYALQRAMEGIGPQLKAKAAPTSDSTAPEHAAVGVDDRELSEIVTEFNDAHASTVEGDEQITHVFDAPKKGEVVRLNDKAKVYHAEHGWMTPAEARAKIDEWKAHAEAQGETSANRDKIVLSLFDLTGKWSEPWEAAGYQVWRFDIQDNPNMGDVNNFSTEFFGDWFSDFDGLDVYAILAACPCTDFASAGARHFAAKDNDGRTVASVKLVHQTLATIEYFKPAVWAIENPVGRIEKLGGLPPFRLSFDPNSIGETYTKKTLLWGRFNGDLPVAPVEPVEGSKMWSQYGGKSLATKNARSATPEGFAYGFFMANNAIDHPVMAIANKYDRLNRDIIDLAVKAGVTEAEISEAVDDFYYMELDDDAANEAIRDLYLQAKPDPTPKQTALKTIQDSRKRTITTPAGTKVKVRLAVAEAATLAKAEGAMQNRDRSRAATDLQVQDIIAKFNPELLGDDPSSDRGAPIVGKDNTVYSGNGRMLALNKIYESHPDKAEAYRAMIRNHGFATTGLQRPVLVRRIDEDMSDEDLRRFVIESNADNKLAMSATERSRSDADALNASTLSLYRGGPLGLAVNADFMRAFMGSLPQAERGALIGSDGGLNQEGIRRAQNALMARAYGDSGLLEKLVEDQSADNNIKSIGGAMLDQSAAWAMLRARIAEHEVEPEFDVTEQLVEAARIVSTARDQGQKIGDVLAQVDAFNPRSPVTEAFIRAFYNDTLTRAAGREAIGDALARYISEASQQTTGPRLFAMDNVGPLQILERGKGKAADLFAEPAPFVPEGSPSAGDEPRHPKTGETLAAAQARARAELTKYPAVGGDAHPGSHNIPADTVMANGQTRRALRREIADKLLEGKATIGREAHLILGPPAAGKSSMADPLAEARGARIIDSDDAKKLLPEFDDGMGAMIVHEESSAIAEAAEAEAIQRGENIILPLVGKTYSGVVARVETLEAAGYKVYVHLVELPTDEAVSRAIGRFVSRGRLVDPDYIRSVGDKPTESFNRLISEHGDKLEGYIHVSNEVPQGQTAKVIKTSDEAFSRELGFGGGPLAREGAEGARQEAQRDGSRNPRPDLPVKPAAARKPSGNKIFTDDMAEQARARLLAKRQSLRNLGGDARASLDMEAMQDGIILAGYHIEKGARSFAAFADAVLSDVGREFLPYLRSWYEAIRYNPDAASFHKDMSTPEEIGAALARLETAPETDTEVAEAPENGQAASDSSGDVGSDGERAPVEAGLAGGSADSDRASGVLGAGATQDDRGAGRRSGGGAGTRSDRTDAGSREGEPQGGDAVDGRAGDSREGLAVEGTGERGRTAVARPARRAAGYADYHIKDPAKVIGGTPKVRFARNMAAIEAYQAISEAQRQPKPAELEAMAGYTGWGSFGQELFQGSWAYGMPKPNWQAENDWLRAHLGKEEWESAQRSIINAHYTDPPTVQAMWKMVERMGFTGGRVLEPSMGIGNFFSLMPRPLKDASDLTGIEMDSLTGGMAKLLFPNSTIQQMPYQDSRTPDGFYDLVIGNWPFAADGPADRRYLKLAPSLHDFFFLKGLDQTRAGGIVIGVTSAGTMDKKGRATRIEIAKKAELVAAIRLPTGAFAEYAGTAVVTDILIFKKRETPILDVSGEGWIETVERKVPGEHGGVQPITVNEYWTKHDKNVLGELRFGSGTTYGRPAMIVQRPADLAEQLKKAAKRVPAGIFEAVERGSEPRFVTSNTVNRYGTVIVGEDGELYQSQGERSVRVDDLAKKALTADQKAQVKALAGLRPLYATLIDAERDGADTVEESRKALRTAYEAFRKKHGPIADSAGLKLLRGLNDPSQSTIAALERADGSPSLILSQAIARANRKLDNPTVTEAFVVQRNKGMRVDLAAIADDAKADEATVEAELVNSRAIFRVPGGGFEVADLFLSGNVRAKLADALLAQEQGEDMALTIEALREVQPKDIPYFQIEAKLGATWVGNEDYRAFVAHMLGTNSDKNQIGFKAGRWRVKLDSNLLHRPEATTIWGHDRISFDLLLRHAFNNTNPKIYDRTKDGTTLNEAASKEAAEKATRIREEFSTWAFRDAERRVRLERSYNETMNAIATPRYDGSFLEFPGMALDMYGGPFDLRSHQRNAIWRGIANGRGLYAHEVGTGKTMTIGGIAVEGRRFGVHRKPLLLAHNANSATVAREIEEQYPGAAVLYIDNLSPDTIDVTLKRIRNEDWDVVVMPHSLIDRMALKRETLMALAAEEIAAFEEEAIAASKEGNGPELTIAMMDDPEALKKVRNTTAKQLVHARNKILAEIEKAAMKSSKEGAVAFEDLGIDAIIVDEAHIFKKPPLSTQMQLKGLNTSSSSRSIALNFLTRFIKRNGGGKGVHLFTGTPITNTLTEIFNMMRYVMDDVMKRDSIEEWDAWFNTFADSTSDVELNAAGEYEPVTRLASFVNVAELRRMAGQFLDIVFADDMPEFQPRAAKSGKMLTDPTLTDAERVELVDGRSATGHGRPYKKIINDVAPMGPVQAGIMDILVSRSQQFRNATKKDRRDMMLSGDPRTPIRVETDAANASLDVRLFEPGASDESVSKVNRMVRQVKAIHASHKKATQVIFMERGFKSSSTRMTGDKDNRVKVKVDRFNVVEDIVAKLVKAGIPRAEIAIVDGATAKEKRKQIADKVKKAEIRVVIGSTQTLGTGVNMQDNLRAMHHMDAPWMPGELEQRNGRGWRQGNFWNTVLEYRYITEKLDGRRWQVLSVKDRFIKAFLQADENVRIIEGDAVELKEGDDDISQTLADAAGDPRLLLRNKYKSNIDKLETRERQHTFGVVDAKETAASLAASVKRQEAKLPVAKDDAEFVRKMREKKGSFTATVEGKTFTERADAKAAIQKELEAYRGRHINGRGSATKPKIALNGFELIIDGSSYTPFYSLKRKGEWDVNTPSFEGLESTIRSIATADKTAAERIEEDKATVTRLEAAGELPFAQADRLAKLRQMAKDLEADLQANPAPPPHWLRTGAPVDTEVFVREGDSLAKRVVQGHRWTKDAWLVTTDEGDIDYTDALDSNGQPIYEPRKFESPVVEKPVDQPQQEAAKDNARPVVGRPLDLTAEQEAKVQAEAKAQIAKLLPGDRVALEFVKRFNRDAGGNYFQRVVTLATEASDNPTWTISHESVHAFEAMGLFTPTEWKMLVDQAWKGELRADVERRWADYGLDEAGLQEEAVAELFAGYYDKTVTNAPKTFVGRMLNRLINTVLAVARAYHRVTGNAAGIAKADAASLMKRMASGEVGSRAEGFGKRPRDRAARGTATVTFGRKGMDGPRAMATAAPSSAFAFADPRTEAEFQDATKGVGDGPGLIEKTREWLEDVKNGFSRHWRDLPNLPKFADLQQQLRKLEAAPEAALEETMRHLKALVAGLNRKQMDALRRKVVLDDLMWEAGQDHKLPFGFTPDTLRAELVKLDADLANMPKVTDAVRQRKLANRRLADQMVAAGVLTPEQVKNPAYFRHMVLDYARAEAKNARTKGSKIKSPYWAKRMGSTLAINANLLEAEFDWMQKALTDIATAKTIDWIKKSAHNVREKLRAQAKAENKAGVAAKIAADPALKKLEAKFRQNVAHGLKIVSEALDSGVLVPPPHLQDMADSLVHGGNDGFFPLLSWIMDENKPGAMGAAMVLSATGRRKAWEKQLLGAAYVDADDIKALVDHYKPEGFTTWQPREGQHFFTSKSISEHALDMFIDKLATGNQYEGVSEEELTSALGSIKPQLVVGGDRYTMVIPAEVALTLDAYGDRRAAGMAAQMFGGIQGAWKQWTLINPRRFFKYNINNLSGDLDAIIAGNPGTLLKVGSAAREIYAVWVKKSAPSAAYNEAVERGVFTSGLSVQEIPDVNKVRGLRHLTDGPTKRPDKLLVQAAANVWGALQGSTNFREAVFRYAAYLDYKAKIDSGIPQLKIGYGASVPNMVDAVSDPADRAALLARDLVGDYGSISVAGGWLRRYLIPFWSWTEINTRRYWRLTANAFRVSNARGLATGGLLGAGIAGRTAAMLMVRMAIVYGLIYLWNNVWHDDEEDDLGELQKRQLHLILGRDENGEVRTLRLQGSLSDILSEFGFFDAVAGIKRWEQGAGTIGQAIADTLKAPVNRVLTSTTPIFTTPLEQALDLELWPDAFNPREIKDNWRHVWSTFSAENEYDALFKRPSRGYGRSWEESVVYRRDPGEMAYDTARSIAYDWLENVKGESGGGKTSARSMALRDYKMAMRYGDVEAANAALDEYEKLGGTGKGLKSSIAKANPLGPISKKDRPAFVASLTDEQLDTFRDAEAWYEAVYLKGK